jgi:glutamyl-tRNA synthetase
MEEYVVISIERLTTTAPVFDVEKLKWMNGMYIRAMSDVELTIRLTPFIPSDCPKELVAKILPLIKERLVTLKDFEELSDFFYRDITVDQNMLTKKSTIDTVKEQLMTTREALESLVDKNWTTEIIEQTIRSLSEKYSWKPGQYFMMLRVAVTGKMATPPLFETMEVLGRDKVLSRLSI